MIRGGLIVALAAALMPAALVSAADLAIRDGDVVVFVGDYVTEEYQNRGGDRVAWPTHVESFLAVRYPELKASYFNAAWGNASAGEVVERLDRDVLNRKPTVAVICLGLQEAGLGPFNQATLDQHAAAMKKLLAALKTAGCRTYVMSPPSVDEQRSDRLAEVEYNKTLAKYAEAQKQIAEDAGAVFIDWFGGSMAAREEGLKRNSRFSFSDGGLQHTQESHTFAAGLVLDAFGAEPIKVEISFDWDSGVIESTIPGASVTKQEDGVRVIELPNVPLPWPTLVGLAPVFAETGEADRWSRYQLKITNAPAPGLIMAHENMQVPVIVQQLTAGMNLASVEPLRSLTAAQDLANLIRRKNYTRVHAWRDQELEPLAEPELAEAQQALIAAWYKYVEGYEKMIARMPKSLNLKLELKPLMVAAPQPPADPQ